MVTSSATEVSVLKLLKAGGEGDSYISGQKISDTLCISRSAVWKQIGKLKKMGFDVSSSKAKGYRLNKTSERFNAVEVASLLSTEIVGCEIYFHEKTESTNILASELATAGAPDGTVVIADSQVSGKGRLARSWISPANSNLYTSIILRPEVVPRDAPAMTLVFAVAVAEAIKSYLPQGPSIKWPNDILIGAKKVAGILTEMKADMDRVHYLVCGIGVNLNASPSSEELLSEENSSGLLATSIMEASGERVDRALFTRTLYASIEKWYNVFKLEGFSPVVDLWRGYFKGEGKPVSVNTIGEVVKGICIGIDDSGVLLVREPSGKVRKITSGDMSLSL